MTSLKNASWIAVLAALFSLGFSSSAYRYSQELQSHQKAAPSTVSADAEGISPEDISYLKQLAQETWNYLEKHRAPKTGFPTDTQNAGGKTNTTNIGLYLAALGPATDLGFIEKERPWTRQQKFSNHSPNCLTKRVSSQTGFRYKAKARFRAEFKVFQTSTN